MADTPMDPVEMLRRDVNERFGEMNQRFDALRNDMNERFERVDRRFEAVDQRFDAMEQRFNQRLDQRISESEARVRVLIESVRAEVHLILEHLAPG